MRRLPKNNKKKREKKKGKIFQAVPVSAQSLSGLSLVNIKTWNFL